MSTEHIINILVPIAVQVLATLGVVIAAVVRLMGHIDRRQRETHIATDLAVKKLNGSLRYLINAFDRPAWIKIGTKEPDGTINFRMFEVNNAYQRVFGIPRLHYIGKTDLEAGWDQETAKRFYAHDLQVWATGEPQTFREQIGGVQMSFHKMRWANEDMSVIGVFGYPVMTTQEAIEAQATSTFSPTTKATN